MSNMMLDFIQRIEELTEGQCKVGPGPYGFGVENKHSSDIRLIIITNPDTVQDTVVISPEIKSFEVSVAGFSRSKGRMVTDEEIKKAALHSGDLPTQTVAKAIQALSMQPMQISGKDFGDAFDILAEKEMEAAEAKESVIAKIHEIKNKWDNPVDVVCDEELTTFPTRRIARDFFFEGMCGTEGSERARYTAIFIALEKTDGKMVHDGEPREDNPRIRGVCRFKGDHIGDRQLLDKPTKYNSYIESKNSVIDKIREAKAAAKAEPPATRKPKTHDKSGLEV